MGGERGGTRTSHPLVPIVTKRTRMTESIRMIVTIPEGVRKAHRLAYRRDKANEGLNTPMLFLIVCLSHCYILIYRQTQSHALSQ